MPAAQTADFIPLTSILPTRRAALFDLRDDFNSVDGREFGAGMDAPDHLPSGSHSVYFCGEAYEWRYAVLHGLKASRESNVCAPVEAPVTGGGSVVADGTSGGGASVPGNETRKGRKAMHTSGAARKAAYRANRARVDYTDTPAIVDKLRETAAALDCSVNELLQSMVRFAETNRNWKQVGLYGSRRAGVLQ